MICKQTVLRCDIQNSMLNQSFILQTLKHHTIVFHTAELHTRIIKKK